LQNDPYEVESYGGKQTVNLLKKKPLLLSIHNLLWIAKKEKEAKRKKENLRLLNYFPYPFDLYTRGMKGNLTAFQKAKLLQ
jgi:hypothetical protein